MPKSRTKHWWCAAVSALLFTASLSGTRAVAVPVTEKNVQGIWFNQTGKTSRYAIMREGGVSFRITKDFRYGEWVYMDSNAGRWELSKGIIHEGNMDQPPPSMKITGLTGTSMTVLEIQSGDAQNARWGNPRVFARKQTLAPWAGEILSVIERDLEEEKAASPVDSASLQGLWGDATNPGTPDYRRFFFRIKVNGNLLMLEPAVNNSGTSFAFNAFDCRWMVRGNNLYDRCHGRGWLLLYKVVNFDGDTLTLKRRNINYAGPSGMWSGEKTFRRLATPPDEIRSTLARFD
ncbi:MAG: hypothetical protein JXA20_04285 [Spirochaetes bacterium]|nr:hypothetical protein [Spirochaetota bacterium]